MSDLVKQLTAKYFPDSRESLIIGGISASKLADAHGTPLYAYDGGILTKKFEMLRAALPKCFSIYYSIKANPYLPLVQHFLSLGCGLEIASLGEFHRAIEAGAVPEKLLFAGPGKSATELEAVLSDGIGEIHVESLTELTRISRLCKRLDRRAKVAVRINPSGDVEGGAMRMGGRPAPFGIDEEILDSVLDCILTHPELDLSGIHLFNGTQILDSSVLLLQYQHGLQLARRVAMRLGRPLETLDFGGGLGIPYFQHERELDLGLFAEGLQRLFATVHSDALFRETRFLVEPGRFLVGEGGIYVARVLDVKTSRGKKFVVVDGGMNHHLAASGNLGQTIKRNYPIAILNKLSAPCEETVDVVGPLCTPLDTLARGMVLPHAEIGDLLVIFQSGAYGKSASPLQFLSHPEPKEVFLSSKQNVEGSRQEGGHSQQVPEVPIPTARL